MNIDDLSEEQERDFNKIAHYFFTEIINTLDSFDSEENKREWIKEMENLFKEKE